jgi:hypothetical protein
MSSTNSRSSCGDFGQVELERAPPDDEPLLEKGFVTLGDHASERAGGLSGPIGGDVEHAPRRSLDRHAEEGCAGADASEDELLRE